MGKEPLLHFLTSFIQLSQEIHEWHLDQMNESSESKIDITTVMAAFRNIRKLSNSEDGSLEIKDSKGRIIHIPISQCGKPRKKEIKHTVLILQVLLGNPS